MKVYPRIHTNFLENQKLSMYAGTCDAALRFILLNNKMNHRTSFIIKYIDKKVKVKLDSGQLLDNPYFTSVYYHPTKSQIR